MAKILERIPVQDKMSGRVTKMKLVLDCGHEKFMNMRRQLPVTQTKCRICKELMGK